MHAFTAIRTVASETAKLAIALGAILIPLFFAAVAFEHVRANGSGSAFSVVSILKDVWF